MSVTLRYGHTSAWVSSLIILLLGILRVFQTQMQSYLLREAVSDSPWAEPDALLTVLPRAELLPATELIRDANCWVVCHPH